MYPMPTPPISPFAPAASMLSRGFPAAAGQLSNIPFQQGVAQSGGFLSKLLGGATGGGGLSNISGILQNAQKAIGLYQQISPMVQQYGPLVKSLPALVTMMKGSNNSEESKEEVNEKKSKPSSNSIPKKKTKQKPTSQKKKTVNKKLTKKAISKSKTSTTNKTKEVANGIPAPKLYI